MTDGKIYTVAGGGSSMPGDGGPAASALMDPLYGVAVDGTGQVLVNEFFQHRVRTITP
ncbi:hypothetical protein PE066_14305 [Ramlibacter tataouinensis]|uniref:hypothetical protein n=1 Tax=Ramlibacter tataouinensis TaxID=94132 RepID=UPI0022F386E2|nr:hypothetical protein [Ramlibacter tataouinensis]WBY00633.1 hypothetical protein PE066_14305 [Ramlibacter tataouinensis]